MQQSHQDGVYAGVAERHPDAAVIAPPRCTTVLSDKAATTPTQRDHHFQWIAERSRMAWQKASGYNKRAKIEAAIGRSKQVIGDGLRSSRETSGDRSQRGGRCPQPHAGARTPELCPHRLTPNGNWGSLRTHL
jgi:hypothetical protein